MGKKVYDLVFSSGVIAIVGGIIAVISGIVGLVCGIRLLNGKSSVQF